MKRCLDCQEYTEDNEADECAHCLSQFEEGSGNKSYTDQKGEKK